MADDFDYGCHMFLIKMEDGLISADIVAPNLTLTSNLKTNESVRKKMGDYWIMLDSMAPRRNRWQPYPNLNVWYVKKYGVSHL